METKTGDFSDRVKPGGVMSQMDKPTNCDGCGACCMNQNLLPLTGHKVDPEPWPDELKAALIRVWNGYLHGDDGCPCVWLDRLTGRCVHYEYRPKLCRDAIQLGDEACMRLRAAVGIVD